MILEPKVIKQVIPFMSGVLILFGYLKLSFFYNHFGIRIIDFVEFTEILTLFLPDIVYYGSLILGIYFFRFIVDSQDFVERENLSKHLLESQESFKKRIKSHFKLKPELFILSAFLVVIAVFAATFSPEIFSEYSVLMLFPPTLLIFNVILFEFRRKYILHFEMEFNRTISNLVIIAFLFGYYSIVSVQHKIREVKSGKYKVEFDYNQQHVAPDETTLYLGQTRNYLFLFNKKSNSSSVFRRSEIGKLDIYSTD